MKKSTRNSLSAYAKGIASEVKLRMLSYNDLDPLKALNRAFNEELKLM